MANTKSSSTDTNTNPLAALTAEQRKALTSILDFCKERSNAPAELGYSAYEVLEFVQNPEPFEGEYPPAAGPLS